MGPVGINQENLQLMTKCSKCVSQRMFPQLIKKPNEMQQVLETFSLDPCRHFLEWHYGIFRAQTIPRDFQWQKRKR